jgi:hypothetical protein
VCSVNWSTCPDSTSLAEQDSDLGRALWVVLAVNPSRNLGVCAPTPAGQPVPQCSLGHPAPLSATLWPAVRPVGSRQDLCC